MSPIRIRHSGMYRGLLSSLLTFSFCLHSATMAQERDQGKEIVKDLLRTLIESQLERDGLRNPQRPGPPGVPPGGQGTAEILQLRPVVTALAQEATNLNTLTSSQARRNPDLRRLLPDLLKFQTMATALKQRTDIERDHRVMAEACRQLSQDWKNLAFRLQSISGLSPQSRQSIERVSQLEVQISQLFGIQDAFDGRELVRTADMLVADLRVLVDEVSYSSGGTASRTRLPISLRRHQERASQFANLAASGTPLRSLLVDYQNLYRDWQTIRPDVEQLSSRTISRTLARIQETHRSLHRVLRLNFGIDPGIALRLVEQLQRDLTDLSRTITLEQIMTVPEPRSVAVAADALLGNAANLQDVLSRREDLQVIAEAWFYFDEAWRIFAYHVENIQNPDSRRRIEGINQSMESLRNTLGITVSFDPQEIVSRIAAVHVLAEKIQTETQRWLSRPGQQDQNLRRLVDQFEMRCSELTQLPASRRNQAALLAKCDEIISLWQQIRPQLQRCTTEEKDSLERTADSLTPELVRLRMMTEE